MFKAHPWHGVAIGPDAPRRVTVFIEIVPADTVKYELDKDSGLLKVDRPQLYSNVCPSPYGFVPRTLCGPEVARLAEERTGRRGLVGDDDPLDIVVLTEKDFEHGDLLVQALPIGGLGMLDGNEVDDKIVAVMAKDAVYGGVSDIGQLPSLLTDRLKHYFLTYKQAPEDTQLACELLRVYGRDEACEVIRRSQADYAVRFAPALGSLVAKG
jgi:inorganic pyrophosphatase